MSWLQKLLPPKINRTSTGARKTVPEGLWTKCESCSAVLYATAIRIVSTVGGGGAFQDRLHRLSPFVTGIHAQQSLKAVWTRKPFCRVCETGDVTTRHTGKFLD